MKSSIRAVLHAVCTIIQARPCSAATVLVTGRPLRLQGQRRHRSGEIFAALFTIAHADDRLQLMACALS